MVLKTPDLSLLSPWHLSFSRQSDKLDTFSLYLLLDLKSTSGWKSGIFGCYLYLEGQVPSGNYLGYDRDQTQASDIQIICHGSSLSPSQPPLHHRVCSQTASRLNVTDFSSDSKSSHPRTFILASGGEGYCGFNYWRFEDWKENPLIFYSHSREHTSTLNSN